MGKDNESFRYLFHLIPVAHPDLVAWLPCEKAMKYLICIVYDKACVAIFPVVASFHLASKEQASKLHAIAYPQDGNAKIKDFRTNLGCVLIVDA